MKKIAVRKLVASTKTKKQARKSLPAKKVKMKKARASASETKVVTKEVSRKVKAATAKIKSRRTKMETVSTPPLEVQQEVPEVFQGSLITVLAQVSETDKYVNRRLPSSSRFASHSGLVKIQVSPIRGDERNGEGIVLIPHPKLTTITYRDKIRFAGGTEQSPAKYCGHVN